MAKFIRAYDGPWHVAEVREVVYGGKVDRTYTVTACRGQQIGGAWGHTTRQHDHQPRWQDICKHCQKLLTKENVQ